MPKPISPAQNAALANVFAPEALTFHPQAVDIGAQWARVYILQAFPSSVEIGWLTRLANLPGVTLSLQTQPEDPLQIVQALNRRIGQLGGQLATLKGGPLVAQRLERQMADAETLIRQIDAEQQQVFQVAVFLIVHAVDATTGLGACRRLEATCAAQGLRARPLIYRQELGLLAGGPWGLWPKGLQGDTPHTWPVATLAAAWPFGGGGINHGSGMVLGHDQDGGLVLINRWDPPIETGITNKNFAVLAPPGGGKSHTVKLALVREWALGAKVIVIDPEREYRPMAQALGGTWVNAAGGGTRVNPLQAPALPSDQDDDGNPIGSTPLVAHIQRVLDFLATYLPDLTAIQRAHLEQAVEQAYADAGICLDSTPEQIAAISAAAWPHVGTVYQICQHHGPESDAWQTLSALLRTAGEGVLSTLWAGPSTVPATQDANFVVLDIHDLDDSPEHVKRAQYVNVLGYAWDLIRADRSEKKLLVVDEAWMLIAPDAPEALKFMKSLSKRIRKYEGSFTVVTQNVIDFLAPSIRDDGEQVLTNSAFVLLLRQGGKDLQALTELFALSDAEQDKLTNAHVGEGLLIAGNQRAWIHVDTSPQEMALLYGPQRG